MDSNTGSTNVINNMQYITQFVINDNKKATGYVL